MGKKLWARRSAPKKRRRAQRKRVRPVKQACSDTIRKRFLQQAKLLPRGSALRSTKRHTQLQHSHHVQCLLPPFTSPSPIPTTAPLIAQSSTSGTVSWSVLNSLSLEANKTNVGLEPIRPLLAPALLNTREHGGYAGTCV